MTYKVTRRQGRRQLVSAVLAHGSPRALRPLLDRKAFPNCASVQYNGWLRERGVFTSQLVHPLPADSQQDSDLANADEMMHHAATVLDSRLVPGQARRRLDSRQG